MAATDLRNLVYQRRQDPFFHQLIQSLCAQHSAKNLLLQEVRRELSQVVSDDSLELAMSEVDTVSRNEEMGAAEAARLIRKDLLPFLEEAKKTTKVSVSKAKAKAKAATAPIKFPFGSFLPTVPSVIWGKETDVLDFLTQIRVYTRRDYPDYRTRRFLSSTNDSMGPGNLRSGLWRDAVHQRSRFQSLMLNLDSKPQVLFVDNLCEVSSQYTQGGFLDRGINALKIIGAWCKTNSVILIAGVCIPERTPYSSATVSLYSDRGYRYDVSRDARGGLFVDYQGMYQKIEEI